LDKLVFDFENEKLSLDNSKGSLNYLSHAHSDHLFLTNNPSNKIICSSLTAEFASINKEKLFYSKNLRLFNAGHIPGSTQIKFFSSVYGEVVYSGDLKLEDDLTTKGAEILQADTLIIDGTYGAYDIEFQKRQDLYETLYQLIKQNKDFNQIWGGYRLGKAQELIKFFNEYFSVAPIVSKEIANIAQIYNKNSIKLDFVVAGSEESNELVKDQFFAVFEPSKINSEFLNKINNVHKRKTLAFIATGWAKVYTKKPGLINFFPLSDHLDFKDILYYCKESQAKRVFVAFGKNEITARKLRKHNINAFAIEQLVSSNHNIFQF